MAVHVQWLIACWEVCLAVRLLILDRQVTRGRCMPSSVWPIPHGFGTAVGEPLTSNPAKRTLVWDDCFCPASTIPCIRIGRHKIIREA
ncbi:hypothetical protein GGR56DRAFT_273032 [Xylariaceae sp. FL0804]|nr:hypothetical protein GGR56DRAFT_273032 [Xylariaceae sp. FL0804]